MTETATVTVSTSEDDIMEGTSGSILPGVRAKVIDFEGKEVTAYDTPGELWIQSPSTTLGYLNNEVATSEAYVWDDDGRWMKTGDEVIVTKSPKGNEHVKIVDRIKELIKVKVCCAFLPVPNILALLSLTHRRVTKSPLPNSKPTSSRTPLWMTAPSSPSHMLKRVKHPRPSW